VVVVTARCPLQHPPEVLRSRNGPSSNLLQALDLATGQLRAELKDPERHAFLDHTLAVSGEVVLYTDYSHGRLRVWRPGQAGALLVPPYLFVRHDRQGLAAYRFGP
jgi:hypothetical protein